MGTESIAGGYDTTHVAARETAIQAANRSKTASIMAVLAFDLHPGAEVDGSDAESAAKACLRDVLAALGLRDADVANRCRGCGAPIPQRVMKDVGAPTGQPRRYCGASCAAKRGQVTP